MWVDSGDRGICIKAFDSAGPQICVLFLYADAGTKRKKVKKKKKESTSPAWSWIAKILGAREREGRKLFFVVFFEKAVFCVLDQFFLRQFPYRMCAEECVL